MAMNILLLGKTGAGKSSLGNSILGHRAFVAKGSTTSVTLRSKKDVGILEDGRKVYVVDTPGVADTGYSIDVGREMFFNAIQEAIAMSPHGYHALLYVIKYGDRLTQEDVDIMKYLKRVFGDGFLKNYGIIAMTNGDNFKEHYEEDGVSFSDFCRQQQGLFAQVYREVNGRVVLFDNTRRCPDKEKMLQRKQLATAIDNLAFSGHAYTDQHFEAAQQEYRIALAEKANALFEEKIRDETSMIIAEFIQIEKDQDQHIDRNIPRLGHLLGRLQKLLKAISQMDGRTGIARESEVMVMRVLQRVEKHNDHLNCVKKMKEQESRHQAELKERQEQSKQETQQVLREFHEFRDKHNTSIFGRIKKAVVGFFKAAKRVVSTFF